MSACLYVILSCALCTVLLVYTHYVIYLSGKWIYPSVFSSSWQPQTIHRVGITKFTTYIRICNTSKLNNTTVYCIIVTHCLVFAYKREWISQMYIFRVCVRKVVSTGQLPFLSAHLIFSLLVFVTSGTARQEGLSIKKIPLTPQRIDLATFRLW